MALGGDGGSSFCLGKGEGSMVLLWPALHSAASPQIVLTRTIDPSPQTVLWSRTPPARACWGFGGMVGMTSSPRPKLRGLWPKDGNDPPAPAAQRAARCPPTMPT
jgi:hypothetical protein